MTGMVLALAGLACGDGGQSTGAATAPVWSQPFAGKWEGTWVKGFSPKARPAEIRGDLLRGFWDGGFPASFAGTIHADGAGRLTLTADEDRVWLGIYKVEGTQLTLCISASHELPRPPKIGPAPSTIFLTLHPAPRKP
jgi:hypothetical protein